MRDFFEAVETRQPDPWPANQAHLHWHLLFDTGEVRRRLTDPYRGLVRRPGIEPVPPEWVHMTVLHSGPAVEARPGEVRRITDRVRERADGVGPLEVTFAQPAVGTVAVECLGRPGLPARRLHTMTWEETCAVVGDRWPLRPAAYYPHLTLGYAGAAAASADRSAMKVWLSDHGQGEVTLAATTLAFVAQWHDHRRIVWDVLDEIPLRREP